jgi:plasmid stabilization system protein ParE
MVVSFHELAERELNDAAQYYEQERTGLGAAFIAEVQRCAAGILEHPEAGRVIRGKVRRRLCRRFPYGLLYTVEPNAIRVLAVMNLRRRPTYWVGRS